MASSPQMANHDLYTANGKQLSSILSLLKSCAKKKDLDTGSSLHADLLRGGFLGQSPYIATILINMYAKCGMISKAKQLLEELSIRDVVCWSALITGYCQQRQGHEALSCFQRMQIECISPDVVAFTCFLNVCGIIGDMHKGKQAHIQVANRGFVLKDIALGTALVDMYAKCELLDYAKRVLKDEILHRNVVSWSALIAGYVDVGRFYEALECLKELRNDGHAPNAITFVSILKACGSIGDIKKGEKFHEEILNRGLLGKNYTTLSIALVDMYVKCGLPTKAQQVLEGLPVQNVIAWSALIAGYVQQGTFHQALNCFERMQNEGLSPNAITFTCILKACASIGAIHKGRNIHDEVLRMGLLERDVVLGNALVDMYAKCGMLEKAHKVLKELPVRDVVSWCTLISGYAQQGQCGQALDCFEQMKNEDLSPDNIAFVCALKACGHIGNIDKGERIHNEILTRGLLKKDIVIGTALVDMYVKCDMLGTARVVHEKLHCRDVVSWNSLVAGYAKQGKGYEALKCFTQMQSEGVPPNSVTFNGILKACGSIDMASRFTNDILV